MQSPIYRQLQENLKKQILSGIYKEGDLLPSENELSAIHKVTRTTVRQALEELVKEKFIIKERGKGSIVHRKRKSLGLLSVKGFSQVVSETKKKVKTIVLQKPSVVAWDENFFYPLSDLEKAAGCIFVKRLRCVDEEPVMLEYTYIPNLNLPRFCTRPFVNGSLFETLNVNYHIDMISVEQDCRAILADDEFTSSLKVKMGAPILHLYLKFVTNREGLNLYSILFCNTEKYSIGNIL